jgi:hypothetical protein
MCVDLEDDPDPHKLFDCGQKVMYDVSKQGEVVC